MQHISRMADPPLFITGHSLLFKYFFVVSNLQDSENEDPSKVTEDAILDSLFYACDESSEGIVPVSRLIEYLRHAISNGTEEFDGNLDDLSLMLDPEGRDIEIDISTFQLGIKDWINEIRRRSFVSNTDEEFHSPVAVNCTESPEPMYSDHNGLSPVKSIPNISSDSVEGLGGVCSPGSDWDHTSELVNAVEELQLNNKRLSEQHTAIQTQMENTEETNAQLAVELEAVKKQLRSAHILLEKNKEVAEENVDLRQTVAESQDHAESLKTNLSQLEKDKSMQETFIKGMQAKLVEVQGRLEALQEERLVLVQALADQKQLCSELEELQGVRDELGDEDSLSRSGHMASVIAELSTANEELKVEKAKLEEAMTELQEELHRGRQLDLSGIMPPDIGSMLTSTPAALKHFTLRQELQAQETFATSNLPSPMVGSPFPNESSDNDTLDMSVGSMSQSWPSSVLYDSIGNYSSLAAQLASEFREKREKALQQIDELIALENSSEIKDSRHDVSLTKPVLRKLFAQDMDCFVEKISSLSHKKRVAEKRSAKLLVAVKRLKEERKLMMEERDKALQKLGNLSLCGDELGSRLAVLKEELNEERLKTQTMAETINQLEQQLDSITQELLRTKEERNTLTESLDTQTQQRVSLEKQLDDMKRTQADLETQQLLSAVRIKEVESELMRSASHLTLEKKRASTLEESLQLSVSRHSEELQEILEIIPTSPESLSNSKQSPRSSVTGHAVKTRLTEYLTQNDATRNTKFVSDPPDGTPVSELESAALNTAALSATATQVREDPDFTIPCAEQWEDVEIKHHSSSDRVTNLSQLSPLIIACPPIEFREEHSLQDSLAGHLSPSQRQLCVSTSVQTNAYDSQSVSSQTDAAWSDQDPAVNRVSGDTIVRLEEPSEVIKECRTISSQTESAPEPLCIVTEAAPTPKEEGIHVSDAQSRGNEVAVHESETNLRVERERSATSLWRRKISAALKCPEELEMFTSDSGYESRPNARTFIDGVSLCVSPAPNEKEIEKQFKTLVLAFQTDQFTLVRRLEVQARSRDMAEANMNRELQNMDNFLKEFEKFCITRDTQDQLFKMKKHMEVLQNSLKRLSTQAQQHGCVQQESRMSSGIEVTISHAENLTRHLEILQEDLDELRKKERLQAEESETPVVPTIVNGPSSLGRPCSTCNSVSEDVPQVMEMSEHKEGEDHESGRKNSLLNFVLALHSTSVRAKEALRSFRKRTEASNARRKEQQAELVKLSEEAQQEEDEDPPGEENPADKESQDSSSNESEKNGSAQDSSTDDDKDVTREEDANDISNRDVLETLSQQKRSICHCCCRVFFYFIISIIVCLGILAVTLVIINIYTPSRFRSTREIIWPYIHEYLEPIEKILYYTLPPVE